jgi:hypothetical protein
LDRNVAAPWQSFCLLRSEATTKAVTARLGRVAR